VFKRNEGPKLQFLIIGKKAIMKGVIKISEKSETNTLKMFVSNFKRKI
jgi:hypothetical protein